MWPIVLIRRMRDESIGQVSPRIRSGIIRKRQSYIAAAWDRLGYSLERRNACRYSVTSHAAFVGWWQDGEFQTTRATLENISLEGALTHVEKTPTTKGNIWVCLDGIPPSAWVEAEVIEIIRERRGRAMVRLKFQETCPFGFFNSAIDPLCQETTRRAPESSSTASNRPNA